MKTEKSELNNTGDMRSQAEEHLNGGQKVPVDSKAAGAGDAIALVHELQVHQIELEMQNEELKRAKLETEDALSKYSDLYDFAPFGLFTIDMQGLIQEVNLLGASLLGIDRRNLMNRPFQLFVAPKDRPSFDEFCKSAFKTSIKQTCDLKLLRDGKPTVHARIEGVATEDDSLNGRQCRIAVIDVTERKKAEEGLERSNQKINEILSSIQDDFYVLDRDWNFVYASKRFTSRIGKEPKDFIGRNIWEMFPKHIGTVFEENFRTVMDKREIRRFEVGGKYTNAYYRMSVFPSAEGITVLGTDITEQKKTEEALRDSEERFRSAFEDSAIAMALTALDGRLMNVNSSFCQMLLFSESEMIGHRFIEFTHPDDLEANRAGMDALVSGTSPTFQMEKRYIRKDGQIIWVDMSTASVRNAEGKPLYLVTHVQDITKRKDAEEALLKAKDELELRVQERTAELSDAKENLEAINEELQVEISEHEKAEKDLKKAKEAAEAAVEAKAAFLANMSHELRTPMNAVIGFSNLLLDESLTPDQKDYIERIRSGGEVLLALINDVLDFSKVEKNKVELEHHPLSLRALADESLDMVVVQAKDKDLNLALTINYGTPDTIIGDHGRLRQILVNLLGNAVKFTDVGEVSVSISSKPKESNKHQILFGVRDTGIGIPKDKMNLLFQPFSQVEASISNQRGGTGLGLTISKRLVELMGGKIWVESEPGKGSTFHFTIETEVVPGLPAESETPAQSVENLAEQHPLRILVAEDVPSNQKVLVEMLKRMGYRADMAADGVEVLQALERQHYDLILMDIKMPEMDGIAAAKEIRRLWPNNRPKIVAITAYAMEGDREKCIEAGMDDYIAKPVQKGELAEVLKRYALEVL